MATKERRIQIFLKKFLTQQQITTNFMDYLLSQTRQTLERLYPQQGIFSGGLLSGSTSDEFSISTPCVATDGSGRILSLDPVDAAVKFENTLGANYYVGLRYAEIFQETEINVRTGKIEYTFFEEAIGEKGEPDLVTDNGSTITFVVDGVAEVGVKNAGRRCMVWMKRAVGQADAFYTGVVAWQGGKNVITTAHLLGQSAGGVSSNPADYQVFLIGPTVRRNTDLRLDPNVVYLGRATGAGAGNIPSIFNQVGINLLIPAGTINAIADEVKSFLVGGGLITWELSAQTLSWADPIELVIPNKPYNFTIAAGSLAALADGDTAYIDASTLGGTRPLVKVAANSMPNVATNIPILMRRGNNLYFRNGALELKGTDTPTGGRINDITQDLLNYIGATDESDADPNYSTAGVDSVVSQGDNLTLAVDKLNSSASAILNNNPAEQSFLVGPGGQSVFVITNFQFHVNNAIRDVEGYIDGRRLLLDTAGGLDEDFRKIAVDQVETSYVVPEGRRVTFYKQGSAYGGIVPPSPGKLYSDPMDASVIPSADISHDLGSGVRRVRAVYARDLYVNNPVQVTEFGNVSQVKTMINGSASIILAGQPVAKYADGNIYPADSDNAVGKAYCGLALVEIPVGGSGRVFTPGPNLPGVLTGMGFTPGSDIYVGEEPGTFTDDPSTFSDLNDDLIRIGISDCADGVASSMATDLIMTTDVVARV